MLQPVPKTLAILSGFGADVSHRMMKHSDGTHRLGYSLSTVSLGGTNWDYIGRTTVKGVTGSGSAQNIDVFGQINSGQKASAIVRDYSDTITATVNF